MQHVYWNKVLVKDFLPFCEDITGKYLLWMLSIKILMIFQNKNHKMMWHIFHGIHMNSVIVTLIFNIIYYIKYFTILFEWHKILWYISKPKLINFIYNILQFNFPFVRKRRNKIYTKNLWNFLMLIFWMLIFNCNKMCNLNVPMYLVFVTIKLKTQDYING